MNELNYWLDMNLQNQIPQYAFGPTNSREISSTNHSHFHRGHRSTATPMRPNGSNTFLPATTEQDYPMVASSGVVDKVHLSDFYQPMTDDQWMGLPIFNTSMHGTSRLEIMNPHSTQSEDLGTNIHEDSRSEALRCKWDGCNYTGVFGRKAELMRHIEAIHVSPKSYNCPVNHCRRSFNRSDNLKEHIRRVHH
ncbi:hypothetical protein BDV25DRAFT_143036 [Aspergillus avenaceus]|uniref:C2H2-type domain-containing protein n=1 Tax=Aspergillus avenaceus TaxID=36643 RepID=A0A5N6TLB0_ASPAV|nr:hypothetical protein BDV25DRAFT_143036 [Aspergillus avenaceus]